MGSKLDSCSGDTGQASVGTSAMESKIGPVPPITPACHTTRAMVRGERTKQRDVTPWHVPKRATQLSLQCMAEREGKGLGKAPGREVGRGMGVGKGKEQRRGGGAPPPGGGGGGRTRQL